MISLTQDSRPVFDTLRKVLHFENVVDLTRYPNPGFFILGIGLLSVLILQNACAPSSKGPATRPDSDAAHNPAWLQAMVNEQQNTTPQQNAVKTKTTYIVPQQNENALQLPINRIISNEPDNSDPSEPISGIPNNNTTPQNPEPEDRKGFGYGAHQHNNQQVSIVINQEEEKEKPESTQRPLSGLEQLYNSYGLSKGKSLRQYGYSFFVSQHENAKARAAQTDTDDKNTANTTNPSSVIAGPVSPDYILGPGDEVLLNITGAVQINERLIIDGEAQLNIPKVGQVSLLATPYKELRQKIEAVVRQKYRNTQIEVSLGKLHEIRITVIGQVERPGMIFIPANATFMDALITAEGPTTEGSMRRVLLQRRGQRDQVIDLYQYFRSEAKTQDIPLLEGDIIRITDIGPTVAIMGPTAEGIYEYTKEESWQDLIQFAGFRERFTHQKAVLESVNAQGNRWINRITLSESNLKTQPKDGDVLQLEIADARINDQVSIQGPVLRPARYPWKQGMKISDLLRESEGFLVNASLNRALLIRQLGQTRQQDVSPGDQRAEVRTEMIWIDLAAVLSGDPQADLQLQRLDTLKIMTRDQVQDKTTVTIMGAVRKPGTYELSSGMTLQDLIQLAGGPTREAYQGLSNILRSSMTNQKKQLNVSLVPFQLKRVIEGKGQPILLKNQDQIVVRRMQSLQVKVTVEGRVQFPGTYVLPDGFTIADALSAAGGLMKDADLRAAIFTRERIRQMQNQRLDHLNKEQQERFSRVRDMVTRDGHASEAVANDLSLMGLNRLKQNMARYQTLGRIVIDMTPQDFPERRDNLVLENGDQLIIPRRSQTVLVMGRVFNPNAFVWQDDWSVADYLKRAGGLKDDADNDNLYVMLANGEVRALGSGDHQIAMSDYVPRPGDTILAPQEALGRSELHMLNDGLLILRQLVEIGAIGASIPKLGAPSIDISSPQNVNQTPYDGAAYQGLLQRQMLRP